MTHRASVPSRPVQSMRDRRTPVSVVIPTRDGGTQFLHLCRHLRTLRGELDLEVLVIDSGSRDDTAQHAADAGLRVHTIDPADFRHGRTRNLGIQLTSGDVICFLTQDVLPCTPNWPLQFANALRDQDVAGVYGRQVPRDAKSMEMYFVSRNYPAHCMRFEPRHGGHQPTPGRVLFSNAFSAVRRDIAERIPFADEAQFSEDQLWADAVLAAGFSIDYLADVEALHAHRYSMDGLYRRSYEIGRALRARNLAGGATLSESMGFLLTEIRYFIRQGHIHRLPQLLPYEFVRWLGFQAGRYLGRAAVS